MVRDSQRVWNVNQLDLSTWRSQFAPEIIGDSPLIVDALETIRHVAATDCNILITGETGTGKELFARAAHRASPRRNRAFIPVNCAAIPDSLLETELVGASRARKGRVHGGDQQPDRPIPVGTSGYDLPR